MKHIFLLAAVVVIAGCGSATTVVHSLKDPAYLNKPFHKVLVIAPLNSIEGEECFENSMVKYLNDHGIEAACSYQIFPPLRTYTDSEKVMTYKMEGFDCYLEVSIKGSKNAKLHVPSYTSGSVNVDATQNGVFGYGWSSTSGGYTSTVTSSLNMTYDLHDFQNGQTVCRCEAIADLLYSNGWSWGKNTQASVPEAAESISESVGAELMRNRVFVQNRN
jgi:hypothetical protein